MSKRMTKWVFGSTLLATWLVPALAIAEEAAADPAASENWQVPAYKALAAGAAMGLSALGAGYAQAKIGSAGAGTLAERPEVSIWVITLQALPEVIVLLGFVSSIMLVG